MGGQQESGRSDSRVFGGAVPPAKPFNTGAFLCRFFRLVGMETTLLLMRGLAPGFRQKKRPIAGAFFQTSVLFY